MGLTGCIHCHSGWPELPHSGHSIHILCEAQSMVDKTPKNNTSTIVKHVNTSPTISVATYAVIFFALLLALAIVA